MEGMLLALGGALAAASAALALGGHAHAPAGRGALPARLADACCRLGARMPAARLGSIGSARVVAADLRTRASRAGAMLDEPGSYAALALCAALAIALAGVASGGMVGLVAGAAAVAIALPLRASAIERDRAKRLCQEMPAVFRTLAVALGSGKTLHQAVDYVGAQERGAVGDEFGRAALAMRCGSTPAEALLELERRLDAPGVRLMTTALAIAQRTGSPLRDLFMRSARLVERQGEFAQMLEVKTAQVRLSVRVVSFMPAALVAILSIISPDFQQGLMSPVGMGCVAVAAVLDALAIYVIRLLMRGVS